ncbi:bluetail domain-containing putative surface protein [Caulobacter vibrioides]|uniref:bluetail domain-containing putative surface protein n=1 Tax=Caulobacter vibrioides TaxID=155892 RepID=UPI00196AD6C1|nr:bluetail domain-containing putative surface protein [Caulobacter vibrioides]
MASTLHGLKSYYSNVMWADFLRIPATHLDLLTTLSAQVDKGELSLSAAQSQVTRLAINTTSVASLAYTFFTGATPYPQGFNYLVAADGPNGANLNSSYYQSFNLENRYINFAINLGKLGEGATAFKSAYGGLTLAQATAKAYAEIFGFAADAAKVDELLNSPVPNGAGGSYTRQAYFASYGGDGADGIGTKAAMVGWLLAAAAKENVGVYAKANNGFLSDLAADGVAFFQHGLIQAYGAPTPTATPGVNLSVTGAASVSPTATDPGLRSTAGDDTVSVTGAVAGGVTIDLGQGRDTFSARGDIFGTITSQDGGDTVLIGRLGVAPTTEGTPAQVGRVTLGGGGNTVSLLGDMVPGSSLTATGTGNVLNLWRGGSTISGFQTVYLHAGSGPQVTGAAVVYDVTMDPAIPRTGINLGNGALAVLKGTSNAVDVYTPGDPAKGARVDVHLQNFRGAPTTQDIPTAPGWYADRKVDGGYLYLHVQSDGPQDNNATLALHVDSDSVAGMIMGAVNNAAWNRYGDAWSLPNLIIDGAGALTAQISWNFKTIDARRAGDLNLAYTASTRNDAPTTFLLGDQTNHLRVFFDPQFGANPPQPIKFYLGAGVDTISLGASQFDTAASAAVAGTGLGNLYLANGVTPDRAPEIIGFQKGVDHLVLDVQIHALTANIQTYADGKASLQDALAAVSAQVAANTGAVFTWGGDTYVYAQDSVAGLNMRSDRNVGDGLIKIVGVTGLTVGTGSGAFDIHYG